MCLIVSVCFLYLSKDREAKRRAGVRLKRLKTEKIKIKGLNAQ